MWMSTVAWLGLVAITPVDGALEGRRDVDPQVRRVARRAPAAMQSAVIRLPVDDPWIVAGLQAAGVRFRLGRDGQPRHVGSFYPIDAPGAVLGELARLGWRVEIGPARAELTTRVTGEEIGTWAAQARGAVPFAGPTGRDVTILEVDSAIDVFHPHFFHADGGAFPWIDIDGDGVLTPGVDAVDADLDGAAADDEVLVLMDYAWYRLVEGGGREYHAGNATFDPAFDYLFIDFDGNGRRDYGSSEGYEESSPGYGEAMFLPDDANGDGVIDTDERVLLLGTSRVAAYRRGAETWHRGVDLVETRWDTVVDKAHATSVAGILVGGQDRLYRAHRGLLQDAELVVSATASATDGTYESLAADAIEALAWGVDEEGADVALWEYGAWRGVPLDGSNLLDAAITESSAAGTPHICPAGNLGDAGKHTHASTQPLVLEFFAPYAVDMFAIPNWTIDLHWPDPGVELTCTIRKPDGAELVVVPETTQDFGATTVDSTRFDSPGGTALLSVECANWGGSVGQGIWTLECTHDSPGLVVHAFLDDAVTGWDRGVVFTDETIASTLTSPATADGCIVTTNYQLQNPYAVEEGELDIRAGHGPRMDGAKSVDVSAPSDAFGPYPQVVDDPENVELEFGQNNYRMFTGTSGAGPHVTSVVAQLLEVEPAIGPEEIRQRLRDGAATDAFVGANVPDDGWGWGKVRATETIFGEPAEEQPEFIARDLSVEYVPAAGDCSVVVTVADVDWPGASFRWDEDYDGTWEGDFGAEAERTIVVTGEQPSWAMRAEFGRGGWRVGGAALSGEAPPECFGGVGESSASSSEGGEGGAADESEDGSGGSSGSPTQADDGGGGCGCTTEPRPHAAWLVLVIAGLLRRRGARGVQLTGAA